MTKERDEAAKRAVDSMVAHALHDNRIVDVAFIDQVFRPFVEISHHFATAAHQGKMELTELLNSTVDVIAAMIMNQSNYVAGIENIEGRQQYINMFLVNLAASISDILREMYPTEQFATVPGTEMVRDPKKDN